MRPNSRPSRFDVLAPWDFPNSPPRVTLRTTGGGRVRFNPNLYADGKGMCACPSSSSTTDQASKLSPPVPAPHSVCLSLINTWTGSPTERWIPSSSTLLQIFVSIQSMIFVECPYTNEPGREGLAGTLDSMRHSAFVWANTIRWAMIDWMQNEPKRKGIWKVKKFPPPPPTTITKPPHPGRNQ